MQSRREAYSHIHPIRNQCLEIEMNGEYRSTRGGIIKKEEGRIKMVLGDEMKILKSGDLVHIPRNTPHCAMTLSDSAKFFAVKSPSGNGRLDQDFVLAENHEEMLSRILDS